MIRRGVRIVFLRDWLDQNRNVLEPQCSERDYERKIERVSSGSFRSKVLKRGHFMNQEGKQVKKLQGEERIYFEFFSLWLN